ncbi:unnamed protein product [Aureobasidium mustum]|uniref:Uncharacterized protein n=1 Tax=Aureobasidium mustum TaxID=2773714 RepID=A0A9N8JU40_9PEZI|nr:unnamed protein product [Aureobasidium mustum]
MPGSHDLSVENLRLHERIVDSEKQTKHHVIKTTTSAPTTAKHSIRPPPKPSSVAKKRDGSQTHSKANSKTGSKRDGSVRDKEVLVVTVIEEDEDEDAGKLPPKAPSLASRHSGNKAVPAKPAKSKVSSHHDNHKNTWDIYNIPEGIPPPPRNEQMALVKVPAPPVVDTANEGKLKSNKTKAIESGDAEFRDVVFEEVREVTRRRYVVKMPGDKIAEWKF